jgi:cell division protein FtsW
MGGGRGMKITQREAARQLMNFDVVLMGAIAALASLGLIMVLSASGIMAEKVYGDKYALFWKQILFMGVGCAVLVVAARARMEFFYRHTYLWLLVTAGLLALTIFSPFSTTAGGASRWLRLGPMSVQPLEAAKIALVFYLSYFFANKQEMVKTFSVGFLPPILMTCGLCVLLLLQPDFGGAVFLAGLLFLMCLVGGTRIIFLGSAIMLGVFLGVLLVVNSPYRFRRVFSFLDPFKDAQNTGYQLVQSLYGLGSGGWVGQGLGEGKQKLFFLPEAHNDFIMSVVGEELGFVGISLVIILLGVVLWRTIRISIRQEALHDRITAFGMGAILIMGGILNMGVVLGAIPPKGVPMPFLSYGGSHLVSGFFCAGVLLNLSRKVKA